MNDRLDWLLHASFDRELSSDEYEELQQLLREDPDARQRYYEISYLDSELINRFSKEQMVAVIDALGSSDGDEISVMRSAAWYQKLPSYVVLSGLFVLLLLMTIGAINRRFLGHADASSLTPPYVAWLVRGDTLVWEGDHQPAIGRAMVARDYELISGDAELRMLNDVGIAIRGPARFQIIGIARIVLERGKLSIDDATHRAGLELNVADWSIRGIGARFAVEVKPSGNFEAHVFEGTVEVSQLSPSGESQSPTFVRASEALEVEVSTGHHLPAKSDSAGFPIPWKTEIIPIIGGDFEASPDGWGEMNGEPSTRFDEWSGDFCLKSSTVRGIAPKSGASMMQFVSGMRQETPPEFMGQASERYYWLDLTEHRKRWGDRIVTAEISVWFNRVPRIGPGKCEAKVIMAAYRNGITLGLDAWHQRLVQGAPMQAINNSETLLMLDDHPDSWEMVSTRMTIPSEAGVLLLSIRAQNERESFPLHFEDVFADSVSLQVQIGDVTSIVEEPQ